MVGRGRHAAPAAPAGSAPRPRARDTARDSPTRPLRPLNPAWAASVSTAVTGLGYALVDVERVPRGLLRVTIERADAAASADDVDAVTVDDCERVTRQLQYVLEVDGVDYARLEVSSPGLDRALKREADYRRFTGRHVALTLKEPFEGRKNWHGVLSAGDDGGWQLAYDAAPPRALAFTLDEVREARLVPVLDFKGRRPAQRAADADAAPAAPPPDDEQGGTRR